MLFALMAISSFACSDDDPQLGASDIGTNDVADARLTDITDTGWGDSSDTGTDETETNDGDELGLPCEHDTDCASGTCLVNSAFVGGYCTQMDCVSHSDCGVAGFCVEDDQWGDFCAVRCWHDVECRTGYLCLEQASSPVQVCLPGSRPGNEPDGEPCISDNECRGGTCLPEPDWPGGHCTTLGCFTDNGCTTDEDTEALCLERHVMSNYCVVGCQSSSDCREDYHCWEQEEESFCAPAVYQPVGVDPDEAPFLITCQTLSDGSPVNLDFEIDPQTTSYMVTPFANDGAWLYPNAIELPDGTEINLRGENDFQQTGAELLGFTNPTLVPAAPDFQHQLQSGSHTYQIDTDSTEICWYVLQEATSGTTIDLNIYLVGVPGIDARSAAEDEEIATVLSTVEDIYGGAGLTVDTVRFFDVDAEDAQRLQIIRTEADLGELVSLSQPPGESLDDVLSVNVFLVRAFAMAGSGAIGISLGLPGPPALHGTRASGVVFTSEYIGRTLWMGRNNEVDGSIFTGGVFAHEIGHYLGLFHTSEMYGYGSDPLDDTPYCPSDDFPNRCPDRHNLMFPIAGVDQTEVSEQQAWVVGVSPLTKD